MKIISPSQLQFDLFIDKKVLKIFNKYMHIYTIKRKCDWFSQSHNSTYNVRNIIFTFISENIKNYFKK